MKKILSFIILLPVASKVFAVANVNDSYIDYNSYIENPYAGQPMGGGTQVVVESQIPLDQSLWKTLFTGGTYNVGVAAAADYSGFSKMPSLNNWVYGYGVSLFGQTGRIGGFSFGGMVTADNPFFDSQLNGSRQGQSLGMTTEQINQLNEAYIEYQYQNHVQVDAGWIGINNSPWLSPAMSMGSMNPAATYQGALVNVNAGGGWLLTALAFNGAQLGGLSGMSRATYLNQQTNGILPSGSNYFSNGTFAIGSDYKAWDNNYDLRLWAYNFGSYGTLLYSDSNVTINLTKKLSLNFAAQVGTDNGNFAHPNNNVFVNNSLGQISSDFVGAQAQFTYDWLNAGIAYNTIWGPNSAYGNGAIVDPYTVNINDDPLFAEEWNYNMTNANSAGTGYKAFVKFSFLNNNLWIEPSAAKYSSTNPQLDGAYEYDVLFNYAIPQVNGLNILNVFAYEQLPDTNPNGAALTEELFLSYTY